MSEVGMVEAIAQARLGLAAGELPIGASAVLDGEIIARAHTRERSEGRLLVHAELLVLEDVDRLRLSHGERRRVELHATAEPCLMCMGAAMSLFVGEVHYAHAVPGDGALGVMRRWEGDAEVFPNYHRPRIVRHAEHGPVMRGLFDRYVQEQPPGAMRSWASALVARETCWREEV